MFYGNSPQYLAIVAEVLDLAATGGVHPVALGVSPVMLGLGDEYNRGALRASRRQSPDADYSRILSDRGVEVLGVNDFPVAGVIDADILERLRETTRGALISYARDPLPKTTRGHYARIDKRMLAASLAVFHAVSGLLAQRTDISRVYVLNGRFPYQRAVIEAAEQFGREVWHYEKGEKPDTYWLADHSTLDRTATQSSVDAVLASHTSVDALKLGTAWMNRRSSRGSSTNIYSRFFADNEQSESADRKRKLVGIFTSSQDEFAALGPEWHVEEWADQWAAYEHVLSRLADSDYDFYLRVHPNFATKSHASFVREGANLRALQARHPSLRIYWHDEVVNSYALVAESDAVIVWDSTIGLEASGRGIPVWELAASYYDLYTDVHSWFGPSSGPEFDSLEFKVDPERAQRFMAYLDVREPDLSAASVALRESLSPSPGIGLTLTNLASSGGAPTVIVAMRSIADATRHRRSAINRIAVRSFLSRVAESHHRSP